MFDERSRYVGLEIRERVEPDGRRVAYVTRRFVTPKEVYQVGPGVTITDSDRIDLIAHRALGTHAGFWQIADANEAMHPETLTETPGERLAIPAPRPPGAKT